MFMYRCIIQSCFISFFAMLSCAIDYHKYQLRTYLYQARNMYSSDKTGLSDPYAVISFEYYSARSCVVKQSVCPTWDETVISTPIQLFGETQFIIECPPPVTLEFYDKDLLVG